MWLSLLVKKLIIHYALPHISKDPSKVVNPSWVNPQSQGEEIVFCSQCGTKNVTNARFCYSCGHAIQIPQQEKVATPLSATNITTGSVVETHQLDGTIECQQLEAKLRKLKEEQQEAELEQREVKNEFFKTRTKLLDSWWTWFMSEELRNARKIALECDRKFRNATDEERGSRRYLNNLLYSQYGGEALRKADEKLDKIEAALSQVRADRQKLEIKTMEKELLEIESWAIPAEPILKVLDKLIEKEKGQDKCTKM